MTTPGHLAAVGFVRGALVATVASLFGPVVAGGLAAAGVPAFVARWGADLVPIAGLACAGAIGGASLAAGPGVIRAFAGGGLAAGVLLAVTGSPLRGLTGFESPTVVLAYAVTVFGVAFGTWGGVAGAMLGRGVWWRLASAFGLAGSAGGILAVLPPFAARLLPGWAASGAFSQFLSLVAAVGAVALPLAVGGLTTVRLIETEGAEG